MAGGNFAGGSGTEKNPYLIEDAADLSMIRLHPGSAFKMVANINLGVYPYNTGKGWLPIRGFHGILDGNGKRIMNLYINRPEESQIGFFETSSQRNGVVFHVENLMFENADVTGKDHVGIMSGSHDYAQTTGAVPGVPAINRITVTGKVKGENYVGGMFGAVTHSGKIASNLFMEDAFIDVDIVATKGESNFGGIYGANSAGITADKKTNLALSMSNVISASGFSNVINGSLVSSFNPPSYGVEAATPIGKTNCFYDSNRWTGVASSGTKGIATEEMSLKTLADFDKRYVDDKCIWSYREGYRYPQITSHIHDAFFVRNAEGYNVYENGKWVSKFTQSPTAIEAEKIGMKDISQLNFEAWDALRNKDSAEIVNITTGSKGTIKHDDTVDMQLDAAASAGEKNVFRKQISFADFGDSMVTIEKGVVL